MGENAVGYTTSSSAATVTVRVWVNDEKPPPDVQVVFERHAAQMAARSGKPARPVDH